LQLQTEWYWRRGIHTTFERKSSQWNTRNFKKRKHTSKNGRDVNNIKFKGIH